MGNVTVFGLGDMGSGFAKALVNGGHTTTVWNRTQSKVDNAVGFGAIGASTAVEAVDASDVICISMTNYSAARPILLTTEMASNINSEIPDFFASLFKRTSDAGYGEEDAAAVMKMLRKR